MGLRLEESQTQRGDDDDARHPVGGTDGPVGQGVEQASALCSPSLSRESEAGRQSRCWSCAFAAFALALWDWVEGVARAARYQAR